MTLSDASAASPTFTAPNRIADYSLTFSLTVNDGELDSYPDTVTVSVSADDDPPDARAGRNRTVAGGEAVTLSGSGTDPEGGTLTYEWIQRGGPDIDLQGAATATATFTAPRAKQKKVLKFRLKVADPGGNTGRDDVRVTVEPAANAAPVAVATVDSAQVDEGAAVTLDGSASSDADQDQLTYRWTAPNGVTLSDAAASKPTFTAPDRTANYTLEFSLTVNDGTADSAPDTVTVSVAADDDPPTVSAGTDQRVPEGGTVTLAGTAEDPEGQALEFAWKQTGGASVVLSGAPGASRTFTAPSVTEPTDLTFVLTASDGENAPTASVKVTVTPVNDPPTAVAGSPQTVDEGDLVTLDGSGSTDPDNDPLTYAWTVPTGVALSDAAVAAPTFTAPNRVQNYELAFTLVVNDGEHDSAPAEVTVTVEADNDAPTADAGSDQEVSEGETVTLSGSGADPEGGSLTYAWTQTGGPAVTLSHAAVAAPTFTAPSGLASNATLVFSVTVSDGTNTSAADTVTVTVEPANAAPVAVAAVDSAQVDEGATVTLDGTGSSDADQDQLTYRWTGPTGVTLSDAAASKPTFTAPDRTADYTLEFSLTVNDGTADSAADTVTVSVAADDDPPTVSAGTDQRVPEGGTVTLTGTAEDPEGLALEFAWKQTGGPSVVLSGAPGASRTFTAPSATEPTDLTFVLTVSDDANSPTDSVTVTVTPVNDPPTADAGSPQTVDEGDLVTLDGSGSSDPDNDPLTYAWTAPADVALSDAAVAAPTFTAPNRVQDYELAFSLVVNDGKRDSASAGVTVTVNADNDAPTADAGSDQQVLEGATVTLSGSGADPEGESLTYAWTQTGGAAATLSDAKNPSPTFTAPDVAGTATLTFEFAVSDGTNTATDTVTVTVKSANAAPVAVAAVDSAQVDEGAVVTLDGTGSSDADQDPLTYIWTAPSGVTLSDAAASKPTFTAPNRVKGYTLEFSLTVNDGTADSAADAVTVSVSADNDAPTVNAGTDQRVREGESVTLAGTAEDPEGQALVFVWKQTGGPPAILSGVPGASKTFPAPPVTEPTDLTFVLTVSDGANTPTASVKVTVTPVNDPPTAVAGSPQTVDEGDLVTLDGSGSSDPEDDQLTYRWTVPAGVALSDAAVAAPTFTAPNRVQNYELAFSLVVNDGEHDSAPAETTVTVEADNDAPTADAGPDQEVSEGATVTMAGGGTDPEGERLTYAWTQTGGPAVTLSDAKDPGATFTAPDVSENTALTFSLKAGDGTNSPASDTVTVTVKSANSVPTARAGDDIAAVEEDTVTLDGSASSDPDSDPLTYAWTAPPGIALSSNAVAAPTFTAPNRTADYTLEFSLTVNDGTADSAADTVTVAVAADDDAPTADAGTDIAAKGGDRVTLDGTGSRDPEGGTLTYAWTQTSGAAVTLSDAASPQPAFPAPLEGATFAFSLVVNDGTNTSAADAVRVAVAAAPQVTLALGSASIAENGGTTTVTASLPEAARRVFEVEVSESSEAVSLGANATLSFASGATASTGTVTLSAVDDEVYTGNRTATISGTPGAGAPARAPAAVVLTVTDDEVDSAPEFGGASIANQAWAKNAQVALTLPAATGGDGVVTYGLKPALPSGVSFDGATRRIAGTPGARQAPTPYTYTAEDADGDAATLTFRISVDHWRLSVSPKPTGGTVTGTGGISCGSAGNACSATVAGGSATLTATADAGFGLESWTGACASAAGTSCALTVSSATGAGAVFGKLPVCNASATGEADACSAGRYAFVSTTAVYGSCKTNEALGCQDGWMESHSPPPAGVCGAAVDGCDRAEAWRDGENTNAEVRWMCVGQSGTETWTCAGSSGDWSWTCSGGGQTKSCTGTLDGWSPSCSRQSTGADASCFACKPGYSERNGHCVADRSLTVTARGPGSVTGTGVDCPGDCSEAYADGTAVTLKPKPDANAKHTGWGGACAATDEGKNCALTMDADKSVTATFACGSGYGKTGAGACAKHELTVEATGPGKVEPAAGTYPHPHGAVVEVTATPAANAAVAWAGCGSTNGNVCTVTMDMRRTVTAAFSCGSGYGKTDQGACAKHDLTVVATGPGAVEPAAGTYPHPHGAVVEVTATPAANAAVAWAGCGSTNGNVCTVTMDMRRTVTAAFSCGSGYGKTDQGACAKHDLTVVATGPGAVEPAAGTYPHPHGAVVEVTATPAANAAVAWAGCGSTNGNVCTVTMDMRRTVTAAFSCGSGYGKTDQGACAKHDLTVVATGPGGGGAGRRDLPASARRRGGGDRDPGRQRRRGLGRVRLHERERLHGDDGHEADGDRGLLVRVRLREDRPGGVREARSDGRGDGARGGGAGRRDLPASARRRGGGDRDPGRQRRRGLGRGAAPRTGTSAR